MDILYYTLLGAMVVWAVIYRYRTLHGHDYFLAQYITLFAFASLAVGLTIKDQGVAREVARAAFGGERFYLFAAVAYGCFFLYRYVVQRRLGFSLGELFWIGGSGAVGFMVLRDFEPLGGLYIASILAFIGLLLILGALHALLGPVIAALNLALAINYFVESFEFNYAALFNVLDLIHVETGPLRLALLAASTLLGLMEAVRFFGLRGFFDGH